jgi:prephenate dehydrogenase
MEPEKCSGNLHPERREESRSADRIRVEMNGIRSPFSSVTIVGTGLIGGSWGLALKGHGFGGRIIGCDRAQVLARALERGAIDEGQPELTSAMQDADLVILAAPVGVILEQLPHIKAAAPHRALVTDTGSTKRVILARAREVFHGKPLFLGGHPLAGKEISGVEQASATLFRESRYVLTPIESEHLEDERVKAFQALVEQVGARPFVTGAQSHDRVLAFVSHLPQLLATGLASLIADEDRRAAISFELASTGFRDMTRLAESPYSVWHDVCLTNADNLKPALEGLIRKLESMKQQLDDGGLQQAFDDALRLRERWKQVR